MNLQTSLKEAMAAAPRKADMSDAEEFDLLNNPSMQAPEDNPKHTPINKQLAQH